MDKVLKLKQVEGNSLSGKQKQVERTASTPRAGSKLQVNKLNMLDTSTISNISCSEKFEQEDADTTVTNVTVIEVCSDVQSTPSASKSDHKRKTEHDKVPKKRKLSKATDSSDDEDSVVFVENPKKAIQMNQSVSEDFLRLGSNEKEVAIGIFWDIENVRMPKGVNPAVLITKLREKFVDESSTFCEKHFYVVCDVKEESYHLMKQLFEFHVRIIHVPRLKANSSDNVIRDLMHEFVGYNKYCRLVLISGDSDFSHDIHNFRRNKKCDCILIYNKITKESMVRSATSAYLYTDLINEGQEKKGDNGIPQIKPAPTVPSGKENSKPKQAKSELKKEQSSSAQTKPNLARQTAVPPPKQDNPPRVNVHGAKDNKSRQPQPESKRVVMAKNSTTIIHRPFMPNNQRQVRAVQRDWRDNHNAALQARYSPQVNLRNPFLARNPGQFQTQRFNNHNGQYNQFNQYNNNYNNQNNNNGWNGYRNNWSNQFRW